MERLNGESQKSQTRVHFNPVVSQRNYVQVRPRSDPNSNPERVLVTVAVTETPEQVQSHPRHFQYPDRTSKEMPDLLQTTPLFKRKRVNGTNGSADPGNSNLEKPSQTVSEKPCSTPQTSNSNTGGGSLLNGFSFSQIRSDLSQKLMMLHPKKLRGKGKGKGNRRKGQAEQGENSNCDVDQKQRNGGKGPKEGLQLTENTKFEMQTQKEVVAESESRAAEPEAPVPSLPEQTNPQLVLSNKRLIFGRHLSVESGPDMNPEVDEFSVNLDRILETVDQDPRGHPTPRQKAPSASTKDQEIERLVQECCAVSEELSRLTESTSVYADTEHSVKSPPRMYSPPQQPQQNLPKKPPLPPQSSKHFKSVLRTQFLRDPGQTPSPTSSPGKGPLKGIHCRLDDRLTEVKESLSASRSQLSKREPSVEWIEADVRSSQQPDRFGRTLGKVEKVERRDEGESAATPAECWDSIAAEAKERLQRKARKGNYDAGDGHPTHQDQGRECDGDRSSLQRRIVRSCSVGVRMDHLTASKEKEDRSRSMEFLLDEEKQAALMPPENTLMKQGERKVSEHELRIQRSLQRLNVPEWYKAYATNSASTTPTAPSPSKPFGGGLAGGWTGLSSKTSSLSSLRGAGSYSGSKTGFGSRNRGGTSLMSPSSTASASPSPYHERTSFPYALTRFATARMSCGASPASLSPSPSPVGGLTSSTSTPVSSGPGMARYHSSYNKTPYLGWRSQERLNSKTMYRTPSERLAADLLTNKSKPSPVTPTAATPISTDNSEISLGVTSPRKETASDLSLNISDTSESSNKLNRVRSSIKEVSNAIVDYVNETKPLDEMNGRASPRKGFVWLESSFVGTKPIDSPSTPDNPSVMISRHLNLGASHSALPPSTLASVSGRRASPKEKEQPKYNQNGDKDKNAHQSQPVANYFTRNASESGGSSAVTSPTLDDILDSLLALRRPQKKFKEKGPPAKVSPKRSPVKEKWEEPPPSDWQQRLNPPLDESMIFPQDEEPFERSNRKEEALGVEGAGEEEEVRVAQEESGFGSPTEIQPPTLILHNPLAGLQEAGGTPVRHRRVSFDLDVSDKEERSSSRSRPRDSESIGGTIQCKNSKCGKTATGLEARRDFKTCHNCNAYYCSRECRRGHWEKHKKVCMQSRVGQLCKQIIGHVKEDSFVVSELSTVAKRGFLAKGRGCVKLFFSSPDRAERFLSGGFPELPEPWYIPAADMLPEEMGATTFSELSDSCRTYNPETRFILYASVCVVNEVPTSGAVKWEREMISRSAKIRLLIPRAMDPNQAHHQPSIPAHLNPEEFDTRAYSPTPLLGPEDSSGDNETLILRSVPTPAALKLNTMDDHRRREISFTNIQKHLLERGVDLRRQYPDIYSKLCNYVENDEPFLPVTIYPRNSSTGATFMCVIMPESSDLAYHGVADQDPGSTRRVETINISE